jgi:hypothetical protein
MLRRSASVRRCLQDANGARRRSWPQHYTSIDLMMQFDRLTSPDYLTLAIDDPSHKRTTAETKARPITNMPELHNANETNSPSEDKTSHEDQPTRYQSDGSSAIHAKANHEEFVRRDKVPSLSSSSGPASASAVSAIMGPPPPPEDKKVSRWERWRQDRREARELGMPSGGSSRRWKVGNVVS